MRKMVSVIFSAQVGFVLWYGFANRLHSAARGYWWCSPIFSILYTCIERALCQHCLDSLLVGSMWFSGGCFPTAIVWWCMGRRGHLSHCALFSLVMLVCELCQVFTVDIWCYNGDAKEECEHETALGPRPVCNSLSSENKMDSKLNQFVYGF